MDLIVVVTFLSIHTVICLFSMVDLISVSQRQNKFQWAMLLTFVPLVSTVFYFRTRKRNRPHNG